MNQEEFQKLVLKKLDKLDNIETKINNMELQLNENTQILKALEHKAEVNKAEHDKILNDIAHIQGNIKSVDNVKTVLKENAENILKAI